MQAHPDNIAHQGVASRVNQERGYVLWEDARRVEGCLRLVLDCGHCQDFELVESRITSRQAWRMTPEWRAPSRAANRYSTAVAPRRSRFTSTVVRGGRQ